MPSTEILAAATSLFTKAVILAAKWAGAGRRRALESVAAMSADERDKELIFLRDRIEQLELQISILRKHVGKHAKCPRYTLAERLHVLWYLEVFQIPRRRVGDYFGIARSTLYRWLRKIDDAARASVPHNRTPNEIAQLVWEIAHVHLGWGRVRIANQLALLGVFLAASTVRNILNRPEPPRERTRRREAAAAQPQTDAAPSIRAPYPNSTWSVDCTMVLRWGLWPTQVFVAIDHFSRKVMSVCPLEGPNAGWICNALDAAFTTFGPPRHIISDQHPVFRSAAVTELLEKWHIKHRFGAVGKHGSIAVTERVIWTFKYEWIFRVPLIKSIDHLERLCAELIEWHNGWRPHMTLGGARPDDWYARDLPEHVPRNAKVAPARIERRHFAETRVTGFRLPKAA